MKKITLELQDEVKTVSLTFFVASDKYIGLTNGMVGLPDKGNMENVFEMRRGLDSDGNIVYALVKKEDAV